jgi:hypothetical protein
MAVTELHGGLHCPLGDLFERAATRAPLSELRPLVCVSLSTPRPFPSSNSHQRALTHHPPSSITLIHHPSPITRNYRPITRSTSKLSRQ